jgi:HKD family nuclease
MLNSPSRLKRVCLKVRFLDAELIRKRIRKLTSQSKEIKIGVYSTQKSGLSLILKDLTAFLKMGGSFSLLVGYRTDPDILDEIERLEEIKPVKIGLYDESTFHAKVYIFRLEDNSVTSIIGSSNLTGPAFSTNVEANVEVEGFHGPEKAYDALFEESEKNRKIIRKRLRKFAQMSRNISKSEEDLERRARETIEGKSATWLWNELERQIEKVHDADLRNRLHLLWRGAERRIVSEFRVKKTRNGKKAWLRVRLDFIMRAVILNRYRRLTASEKVRIFKAVIEYTLLDSDLTEKHFTKKPLQGFVSLVKRRGLERTFAKALWSRQKYGRRLFRKLLRVIY